MDELRERLTPERLSELRRVAEAVIEAHEGRRENACGAEDLFDRTFDPPTVLAMLDEIERLRNVAIDPGEHDIDEPVVDWKRTAELRAQEIERLRRERETLAAAVRASEALMQASKRADEDEDAIRKIDFAGLVREFMDAHKDALALLDGEKGGNVNPLAAYTDGQLYDELHRRGWVAATWPTKGGGGA